MVINRKGAGACVIIAHHKFTFIGIKAFLQYMHDTECFSYADARPHERTLWLLFWIYFELEQI